jgi:tRNA(fMet)-specific endonuclease VapC
MGGAGTIRVAPALPAAKLQTSKSRRAALRKHLRSESGVTILEYDRVAAREYGRVRALLEKRGRPIGIADTMIAAHALSQRLTLVTNNGKHFRRVRGLASEDWF